MKAMNVLAWISLVAASLALVGCPGAQPLAEQPAPPRADYEDAVRIKQEAAAKYLKLSTAGASRDGKTLRGVVESVSITQDAVSGQRDTVWLFRDLIGSQMSAERIAIPLADIELLPTLYPNMVTEVPGGINLVESFHLTKNIPQIRTLPIQLYDCAATVPPPAAPPCNCEPFVLGLDLDLSCAGRSYSNLALSALIRGSAFTDGVSPLTEGRFGAGFDAIVGWRLGATKQFMVGATLSTGIATVNGGDVTPRTRTLDDLAVTYRPLVLATGRYYFTPLLPPQQRTAAQTAQRKMADPTPRYIDGRRLPCPSEAHASTHTSSAAAREAGSRADSATSRTETRTDAQASSVVDIDDSCFECRERVRQDVMREFNIHDMQEAAVDPVQDLFGGCIKPYIYGEAGVAVDLRTRNALSMALGLTCNDCVAGIRDANADGSLGVNWALPITFGIGAGVDIPISNALDLEIDLGFRSIAVGDAYQLLGYADVPDTRRINQFQLRIGVMY